MRISSYFKAFSIAVCFFLIASPGAATEQIESQTVSKEESRIRTNLEKLENVGSRYFRFKLETYVAHGFTYANDQIRAEAIFSESIGRSRFREMSLKDEVRGWRAMNIYEELSWRDKEQVKTDIGTISLIRYYAIGQYGTDRCGAFLTEWQRRKKRLSGLLCHYDRSGLTMNDLKRFIGSLSVQDEFVKLDIE